MIRVLRYFFGFLVGTIWYGTRVLTAALAGIRYRPGGLYDQAQRGWARWMLRATGVRVEVVHAERLPAVPVVYVSNHASFIDIWALLDVLPGSVRFVFKKEFLYIPVMGPAMRAIGHISIDRANRASSFESYDRAAEQIKAGVSAVVFAEGARSRDGKLQSFKKGPFVLAISAQVPVVPVYCQNTFALLPRGSVAPRRGTVFVNVGEPIPVDTLQYDDRDRLSAEAHGAIVTLGAVAAG